MTPLLAGRARKVILYQLLIGALVALGLLGVQGIWQAKSALYGGLITVIMTFLLERRVERAGQAAASSARWAMALLFIGFIERFLLVLVMFGVGFKMLKLDPLAAIVGFGLTQLGYLLSAHESTEK